MSLCPTQVRAPLVPMSAALWGGTTQAAALDGAWARATTPQSAGWGYCFMPRSTLRCAPRTSLTTWVTARCGVGWRGLTRVWEVWGGRGARDTGELAQLSWRKGEQVTG